jgi:hypothetical protein
VSAALLGGGAALTGAFAALVIWRRDPARGRLAGFALALWLSSFLSPMGWRTGLIGAIPALHLLLVTSREPRPSAMRAFGRVVLAGTFLVQRLNYEVVGAKAFFWLLAHQQFGISTAVAVLTGLAGAAVLGPGAGLDRAGAEAPPAPSST